MQRKGEILLILKGLICISTLFPLITISMGGESSEFASFFSFIRAVDPKNVLGIDWNIGLARNPCSEHWKGVKCNLEGMRIVAIRLENLGLNGKIDGKSLCSLPNLHFLSLARNQIMGEIPNSILNCTSLRYLNLSSNLLNGNVPIGLSKLKILDISNNYFRTVFRLSKEEILVPSDNVTMGPSTVEATGFEKDQMDVEKTMSLLKWKAWIPFVIVIVFVFLLIIIVNLRSWSLAKEKAIMSSIAKSPKIVPQEKGIEEVKSEEIRSSLVFFVGESERFRMEDLLEAEADLRSQGLCSSLFKVQIKSDAVLAVKRLNKLKASLEDFSDTMTCIGNLNHPNILPLVGFNCTNEEKFLIYRYQSNGSLLTLQEDENDEPLISEYGYSLFIDPETASLFNSNGYTSPERSLSQEADVYSFGVILLELLTGKMVEKSGLDLPKWVKSMVREEWTGEVFDKELRRFEMFSFSLLNIALKCVAHFPENRPSIGEVLEKIEGVVSAYQEFSTSPSSSIEY